MKNVIVACDYAYVEGGAANIAIQTAIALAEQTELNVYFFCGCGDPCKELKNSRVQIVALKMYDLLGNPNKFDAMKRGIWNARAGMEMLKVLSNLNPKETILHIHTWTKVLSSSIFKIAQKMNVPIYLTVHDYFLACPNGGCYNYVKNEICELYPLSIGCLFCNCDSRHYYQKIWRCMRQITQNQIIRKIPDIHYIFISELSHNQLLRRMPAPQFQYRLENPIEFTDRVRFKAEENSIYLYIGRLTEEKGIRMFCQAIHEAKVQGVVIGDGALRIELQHKYPKIKFTGWLPRSEIRNWLRKGRCLIFPTRWYEGAPLTTLEVQAYGIPCIVSDCSSAVNAVIDGITGCVFNADDKSNLIRSILKMRDYKYVKELSCKTYQMFDATKFNKNSYINKLLCIYNDCGGIFNAEK